MKDYSYIDFEEFEAMFEDERWFGVGRKEILIQIKEKISQYPLYEQFDIDEYTKEKFPLFIFRYSKLGLNLDPDLTLTGIFCHYSSKMTKYTMKVMEVEKDKKNLKKLCFNSGIKKIRLYNLTMLNTLNLF